MLLVARLQATKILKVDLPSASGDDVGSQDLGAIKFRQYARVIMKFGRWKKARQWTKFARVELLHGSLLAISWAPAL